MTGRLLHEIAHLAHVELLTPAPDDSLRFFVDVLGLTEVCRAGDSVYLRTWDDYEHHTLKLTARETSGIGRTGLRAASQEALERRVSVLERAGLAPPQHAPDISSFRPICASVARRVVAQLSEATIYCHLLFVVRECFALSCDTRYGCDWRDVSIDRAGLRDALTLG